MGGLEKIKSMIGFSSPKEEVSRPVVQPSGLGPQNVRINGVWYNKNPVTGELVPLGASAVESTGDEQTQKHKAEEEEPDVSQAQPNDEASVVEETSSEEVAAGIKAVESEEESVSVTATTELKGEAQDGAKTPETIGQDEDVVAEPLDVETFSHLCDEVKLTNKIMAEFRKDMQELPRKIDALNSETTSIRAQLDELTTKEAMRAAAIEDVVLENYSLKKDCREWDEKVQALESEKATLEQEIETLKKQILDQDERDKARNEEKENLISAHNEAVSKLNADHKQVVADLKKQQEEKIAALNKSMSEQIQNAYSSIEAFVPSKVCDLFDYRLGELGEAQPKWQSIYAYLCFINGNLRQDAFVKRFREFDAALYDAMRDSPDQLAECRARVQKHINEELGKKSGGLQVCWPKVGEVCNPDHYTTTSDFGQRISEVISAMVYKMGDDGKNLCQSRGRDATA